MPDLEDRIMKRSRLVIMLSAEVLHNAEATAGPPQGENSSRVVKLPCDLCLSGLGCLSFKRQPFANRRTSPRFLVHRIPQFTKAVCSTLIRKLIAGWPCTKDF